MSSTRTASATAIGAAAAGLAIGLAANLGRKALVQGVTTVHGSWDEGLKAEHRLTLKIFDALEATDDNQKRKRGMLLVQLKHALAKHAFEEENVVYPAMRDKGQAEAADALVHDHGYVKQYLYDLTELDATDPAWIGKVRKFRSEIEEHMKREENELFPALRQALGEDGNSQVTAMMNKAGFAAA